MSGESINSEREKFESSKPPVRPDVRPETAPSVPAKEPEYNPASNRPHIYQPPPPRPPSPPPPMQPTNGVAFERTPEEQAAAWAARIDARRKENPGAIS